MRTEWPAPQFSPTEVNRAGEILIADLRSQDDHRWAMDVLDNWRSSHSFPLNTMQMYLRKIARSVDDTAIVAQRIKRPSSIEAKLRDKPRLKLSVIQDIGGCRIVVSDLAAVSRVRNWYECCGIKHVLLREHDYIKKPRVSGYRGIHRVYSYCSGRSVEYNNLQIEVQIRSQLQHAWATAVETVGTFLGYPLKASCGPENWLRFFALAGSAFAMMEGAPTVPQTPSSDSEVLGQLVELIGSLDVFNKLARFSEAVSVLEEPHARDAHYFLVELSSANHTTSVRSFSRGQLADALLSEHRIRQEGGDSVIVSVDSVSMLRRAYPNYYMDASLFTETLNTAIEPLLHLERSRDDIDWGYDRSSE